MAPHHALAARVQHSITNCTSSDGNGSEFDYVLETGCGDRKDLLRIYILYIRRSCHRQDPETSALAPAPDKGGGG